MIPTKQQSAPMPPNLNIPSQSDSIQVIYCDVDIITIQRDMSLVHLCDIWQESGTVPYGLVFTGMKISLNKSGIPWIQNNT